MDALEIDRLLPQTQCEECDYKGCMPYAEAIAKGEADIDLCPPGGTEVVIKLAKILKKDAKPYLQKAMDTYRPSALAYIREDECIGCTKCIQACPVDAIIGTNKKMHTVFTADCTGCRLCVEPCPVDCIEIHEQPIASFDKARSRTLFKARNRRLENIETQKKEKYQKKKSVNTPTDPKAKQAYILEAIQRRLSKK